MPGTPPLQRADIGTTTVVCAPYSQGSPAPINGQHSRRRLLYRNAQRGPVPKDLPPSCPCVLKTVRLCREHRYGLPETLLAEPSPLPTPALASRPRRRAITVPRDSVPPPVRCWEQEVVGCLVRRG